MGDLLVNGTSQEAKATSISVLGLGYMGTGIARAFIEKGFQVCVWNRSPRKADLLVALGAKNSESAAQCASASRIVVFVTTGHKAFRAVFGTLGSSSGVGRILVDFGTGTPAQVRESETLARDRQFDAYIHGGMQAMPADVGRPTAIALYSGPTVAYKEVLPTLTALGRPVYLDDEDPARSALVEVILGTHYYTISASYLQCIALLKRSGHWSPGVAETFTKDFVLPSMQDAQNTLLDLARQIDSGIYKTDAAGCRLDNHLSSLQNFTKTYEEAGANPLSLPVFTKVIEERIAQGGEDEELSSLIDLL